MCVCVAVVAAALRAALGLELGRVCEITRRRASLMAKPSTDEKERKEERERERERKRPSSETLG